MSEDFKKKIEAYEKGELSEAEMKEMEKDIEKLEQYQEYLEGHSPEKKSIPMKEQWLVKRGKWKARFQTTYFVIGFAILILIASSFLTAIYYIIGNKGEVYGDVIDYTLAVTRPYGVYGGTSTNTTPFFGLEATRDLKKRVGGETITVGELEVNFLFSMMGYPNEKLYGNQSQIARGFTYPQNGEKSQADWSYFQQIPEGTVTSAYLSFTELMDTKKVFEQFDGRNLELIWLAVDSGVEKEETMILDPIGFPNFPIWHDDDMIVHSQTTKKGLLWDRVVSQGATSPEYTIGEGEILHEQFMKTLYFLEKYESKVNKFIFEKVDFSDRIQYFEKNGFHHYGVVITGPTKEILKLEKEKWAGNIIIDEVEFWNWTE